MGLDMYLMKRIKDPENEDIGYWRKANAIHQWFVDNVQDGVDNCQEFEVRKEQLEELLEAVDKVIADHEEAKEILPTQGGFFFGSTDYDEYYFEDMLLTKEILERAMKYPDDTRFIYQSSW